MSWMLVAAVILIIKVVVLVKLSQQSEKAPVDYPYQKRGVLFSPADRSFLGVLNQVIGGNVKVFGKVRVADVVSPRKGMPRSDWQKAFNKISGKHFDFLLCSNDDLSVICAIELDDSSHQSKTRQLRDKFLYGVCNAADVPLIQTPAKAGYAMDEVELLIAPYLNIKELPLPEIENTPLEPVIEDKVCPKCSSPMVMRVA